MTLPQAFESRHAEVKRGHAHPQHCTGRRVSSAAAQNKHGAI